MNPPEYIHVKAGMVGMYKDGSVVIFKLYPMEGRPVEVKMNEKDIDTVLKSLKDWQNKLVYNIG